MSARWKLALLVGVVVAAVSLIISYLFPDLSRVIQTMMIVITAIVVSGAGYQIFYIKGRQT